MAKRELAVVTLAECGVMVMNEYGVNHDWKFNLGCLGFLGKSYFKYVNLNNIPKRKQANHPLLRNQAVRNSCKNTKVGKKYWEVVGRINYPGISNAYSDVFELKEEFRKVENNKHCC